MMFLSIYREILQRVDWNLVGLAAVLFSMGVVIGPRVVERKIKFLIGYPLWVYRYLEKILQRKPTFLRLFFFIFCFNGASLFVSFLSGFTGILPFLFAFLTGLNVAVITVKAAGRVGLAAVFFNPVALFELPAAWIALAIGMSLGLEVLNPMLGKTSLQLFGYFLDVFLLLVLPLLCISGLLEAVMISLMLKHDSD